MCSIHHHHLICPFFCLMMKSGSHFSIRQMKRPTVFSLVRARDFQPIFIWQTTMIRKDELTIVVSVCVTRLMKIVFNYLKYHLTSSLLCIFVPLCCAIYLRMSERGWCTPIESVVCVAALRTHFTTKRKANRMEQQKNPAELIPSCCYFDYYP